MHASVDVMSVKYDTEFLYCSIDLDTTLRDNKVKVFCNILYILYIILFEHNM